MDSAVVLEIWVMVWVAVPEAVLMYSAQDQPMDRMVQIYLLDTILKIVHKSPFQKTSLVPSLVKEVVAFGAYGTNQALI